MSKLASSVRRDFNKEKTRVALKVGQGTETSPAGTWAWTQADDGPSPWEPAAAPHLPPRGAGSHLERPGPLPLSCLPKRDNVKLTFRASLQSGCRAGPSPQPSPCWLADLWNSLMGGCFSSHNSWLKTQMTGKYSYYRVIRQSTRKKSWLSDELFLIKTRGSYTKCDGDRKKSLKRVRGQELEMSSKISAMCPKTAPTGQITRVLLTRPGTHITGALPLNRVHDYHPPGSHTHHVWGATRVQSSSTDRFPYLLCTPRLTKIKQLNLFQSVPSTVIQMPNSIFEVIFALKKKKNQLLSRGNSIAETLVTEVTLLQLSISHFTNCFSYLDPVFSFVVGTR